jgi:diguanylate cyclase (GGDEF)-like protein
MALALIVLTVAAAAAGARVAVLHARLRTLQSEAITDPLTGAFHRRQLDATLSAAVERRRRTSERASVLLLDIDRFKNVNDTFGHAEGDRVLQALVALMQQRFRKLDAVFRTGGEEFVLLLPGTRFNDAFAVAEELREMVLDAGLLPGCDISISVGVAELAIEQSARTWIAEADSALYRAKRAGRNRVAGRPPHLDQPVSATVAMPVRLS